MYNDSKNAPENFFKVCATCGYLELLDSGREFPLILDTDFYKYRCNYTGETVTEWPLMKTFNGIIEDDNKKECPYWKPWRDIE